MSEFSNNDELLDEFTIVDPLFGVREPESELRRKVLPVLDEDYEFDADDTQHPCFRFPRLGMPNFGKLPQIVITTPSCCGATGKPILATAGELVSNIATLLLRLIPTPSADSTQPRTMAGTSLARTIVVTPADPQHISPEVITIAPTIALDLLTEFVSNTLISAATSLANMFGFVNAVIEKAEALGNGAAKLIGDQLTFLAASADAGKNFSSSVAGRQALAAANQAAAIAGVRQIPFGINNPNSGRKPTLAVVTDAGLRSSWPQRGVQTSIRQHLTNAANIAVDAAAAAAGLCWAGSAMRVLAQATGFLAQGRGREALSLQIEGMLRLDPWTPINIAGGLQRLAHSWRHECALKLKFDGDLFPPLPKLTDLRASLTSALDGSCTAGMPGTLMYTAYGNVEPEGDDVLQKLPPRVAANLGVPNSDVQLITFYVTDPDKKHNSLTSQLPGIFQGGDPVLAQMRQALRAFQEVILYTAGLSRDEMILVEANVTAIGGTVVNFIRSVRTAATSRLGNVSKLTDDYMNNKLSSARRDLVISLSATWDDLNPDLLAIEDTELRAIVSRIFTPRLATLGNVKMATLLSTGQDALNDYGGFAGPEIVYKAANNAALLRCLVILNDSGHSDTNAVREVVEIMTTASENNADISFGGATETYIEKVAKSGREQLAQPGVSPSNAMLSMSREGLPETIQAAKGFAENTHRITATLNSMMAESRDVRAYDIGKSANEIAVTERNADTQNYMSGALARQKDVTKAIITKSLVNMNAAAAVVSTAGISDKPDNRKEHVERIIKETANSLAYMTLDKTTGIKLNQSFEGIVNQTKHMFNQAGTGIANEAPIIRSTGRMVLNQAAVMLNEADSMDNRGRWQYNLFEQSVGTLTSDYHVLANNSIVQTGLKQSYFGQTGTYVSDLLNTNLSVGPGGGLAQIKMAAPGEIKVSAALAVEINVGLSTIKISPVRIDLNPLAKIPIVPEPIVNKYAARPTMGTEADKSAAKLQQEPGVNPIPVAAPYKSPMTFTPLG